MSLLKRLTDAQPPNRRRKTPPPIDFDDDMGFFSHPSLSAPFLSVPSVPSRQQTRHSARPRDDLDDFLSSDLEFSFASTMSIHSPPRDSVALVADGEPMDISPAPVLKVFSRVPSKESAHGSKPSARPRAFTSSARMFGHDMSNEVIPPLQMPDSKSGSIQAKRTQRGALPSEWFLPSRSAEPVETDTALEEVSRLHSNLDWTPLRRNSNLTFLVSHRRLLALCLEMLWILILRFLWP
jgi:M-phase inducer tyrosine phosphatase